MVSYSLDYQIILASLSDIMHYICDGGMVVF